MEIYQQIPPDAVRIVLVLFLSFLIGLEREERKGAGYKIVSFYAKRARGLMSRYVIVNGITEPEALKGFDAEGYAFIPAASEVDRWVFRRDRS